jgi:hypothetical protein
VLTDHSQRQEKAMLCMTTYPQEYVDSCRTRAEVAAAAFQQLDANSELEPIWFNNLVIVLDACFVHRARAQELKDGNPVNEVRLLAASLLTNGGRLLADKQIRLDPERSVLGLHVGDEIALTAADFDRLAKAYFAEIEVKFG